MILIWIVAVTAVLSAQDWSDRAEYDLALTIRGEHAPAARLALLEQWKQKYPQSPLRHQRAELILTTAQSLGQSERMLEAAREMVAADATSYIGYYWITALAPSASPAATAAVLQGAETAARRTLQATDGFAAVPPEQKNAVKALAHRTLGWVQWKRGSLDAAERELRAGLERNPLNAELSGWLGTVMIAQKASEKKLQAIWHLARGAFLDSDGAMPTTQRGEVRALLDAVYANHHGSLDGLEQLGPQTRAAVNPPADFKIETAAEVAERRRDEELQRTNPELHAWLRIRKRFSLADAEAQFQTLQQGQLPRLKGFVIRCTPEKRPTEIVIGLKEFSVEEAVLTPDTPPAACADIGTALTFEGRATAFTREPFRFVIAVEMAGVHGWPAEKP